MAVFYTLEGDENPANVRGLAALADFVVNQGAYRPISMDDQLSSDARQRVFNAAKRNGPRGELPIGTDETLRRSRERAGEDRHERKDAGGIKMLADIDRKSGVAAPEDCFGGGRDLSGTKARGLIASACQIEWPAQPIETSYLEVARPHQEAI